MTEVLGALWLIVGLGSLAASAVLAALCLRLRSPIEFVLAAYTISWFWLVTLLLLFSPARMVTREWLLAGIGAGLVGALVAWICSGRPDPPPFRPQLKQLSLRAFHPAVLVLGASVLLGLVYSVALALFTPVNEGDSLAYHVARAAFWRQEQRVGYVPNAVDLRLDVSPPNAEIGQLATMLLSGGDRYVAVPQLLAYVVLVLCVAGLARRIGLGVSEAAFGALVFATLPVVVVQSSGALNDLVVASFLAIAALFALGSGYRSLVLIALALGLALGTKVIAVLALPTLVVVAAVARPRREWLALAVAILGGLVAGSVWYVVNLASHGSIDGGLAEDADQRVDVSPDAVVVNAMRFVLDLVDLSGVSRPFGALFVVAALVLAVVGVSRWRTSRRAALLLVVAAMLTAGTLVIPYVAEVGRSVVFRSWMVLGRPPTPQFERGWGLNLAADPTDSWFGPLGVALLAAGTIVVVVLWSRTRLSPTALAFSLAPWLLLLSVATTVVWDPWRGRFLVFGVALAAATWGVLLRWPISAGAASAIAVVMLISALVNYQGKPSGLGQPLGVVNQYGFSIASIWGARRSEAQSRVRGDPSEAAVLAFVERRIPSTATIAFAPRENDYISPYFGPRLTRRVQLVSDSDKVPAEAGWLVLSPGTRVRRCETAWRRELAFHTGWRIERRVGSDACLRRAA